MCYGYFFDNFSGEAVPGTHGILMMLQANVFSWEKRVILILLLLWERESAIIEINSICWLVDWVSSRMNFFPIYVVIVFIFSRKILLLLITWEINFQIYILSNILIIIIICVGIDNKVMLLTYHSIFHAAVWWLITCFFCNKQKYGIYEWKNVMKE